MEVAANILNKLQQEADKKWSSTLNVDRGQKNKSVCHEMLHRASDLDRFLVKTDAMRNEGWKFVD